MDKFGELPIQQRLLIIVIAMLLMAGLVYFLLITDMEAALAKATAEYNKFNKEHQELAKYQESGQLEKLREEEQAERAKIEENKKLLPTEDELPNFIQSIKSDADTVTLDIQKFEVDERQLEDYYTKIPIKVEAVGTFPNLVAFFKTLASPSKRITNVKDLEVKALDFNITKLKNVLGQRSDAMREIEGQELSVEDASRSPEFQRYIKLKQYEALYAQALVEAKFTVYAFTYTGKLMPESEKKKRQQKQRRRRRTR